MRKDLKIIAKGLYDDSVEEGELLVVKQYIFARENGKKCLMLRFLNKSGFIINSFEFWLVQKNSDGVEIAEKKVRLNDILAKPGEIFSPEKCFVVKDKCVDFDIRFIVINSGKYEYRSKEKNTFVRYPIQTNWSYLSFERLYTLQKSKLKGKVRFTSLILVFAVLSTLLAVLWPFISDVLWPLFTRLMERIFD